MQKADLLHTYHIVQNRKIKKKILTIPLLLPKSCLILSIYISFTLQNRKTKTTDLPTITKSSSELSLLNPTVHNISQLLFIKGAVLPLIL